MSDFSISRDDARIISPDDPEAQEFPGRLKFLHIRLYRPFKDVPYHMAYSVLMKQDMLQQGYRFQVADSMPGHLIGDEGWLQFTMAGSEKENDYGGVGYRIPRRGIEPIPVVDLRVVKNSVLDPVLHLIFLALSDFPDFTFEIKVGIEPHPNFIELPVSEGHGLRAISDGGIIRKLDLVIPDKLSKASGIIDGFESNDGREARSSSFKSFLHKYLPF